MRSAFFGFLTLLATQALGQVHEFKLDNGLKVLLKEDHRAPIVVSMVWYNVGSADEPGGITGVSHALEHLMFKGTPKFPLGVFSKTISELGGQENAFTSTDYTAYYEKLAAINLATSFELEADRMQHLLLDPDEFKKEMAVIREERRMRTDDNPQALTYERFTSTAHLAAPYHHPVIGWMSDLLEMQPMDARRWYERYYAPNNATLVVVGDTNLAQVKQLATRYFGTLQARPHPTRKQQLEPPVLGKKQVDVHAPAQVPGLMLGYTVPTAKTVTEKKNKADAMDPYVLELIAGILDAGESSRFNEDLIRKHRIASSLTAQYNIYARYQTQFLIYGTPDNAHDIAQLRKGILAELKRLKSELISDEELTRVKTQIIAQKTFERDSIFTQAMEMGLLETLGLGWQAADQYTDRINSVTPTQIQQVATRYFTTFNLTEARLIPITSTDKSGKPA